MQLLSRPGNSEEHSVTFSHQHPESYVKKELQSAHVVGKSPKDVWSFLFTQLDPKNVLSVVIDFFISAYSAETDFYVNLLRYYVEDGDDQAQMEDLAQLSSPQVHDKRSMEERRSSLKHGIGQRLRDMSEDVLRQSVPHENVERLCKAAAVLVMKDILALEDLWPYMGSSDHLARSETIYKGLVDARIAELQNVYARETEDPSDNAELIMSVLSEREVAQKAFDFKLDQPCSLHIWLLLSLWKEGDVNTVLGMVETYNGVALVHEPLRTSLTTYLFQFLKAEQKENEYLSQFSKTEQKKNKHVSPRTLVRILVFAGDTLGPLFGQNFAFLQEACHHFEHLASCEYPILESLYRGIFPALSVYRVNMDAAKAVWSCLYHVKLSDRVLLYKKWQSLYEEVPILRLVKTVTEHDVKSLLCGLTDARLPRVGESLACLAATNPLIVCKQLLESILETDIPLYAGLYIMDMFNRYTVPKHVPDVLAFTILDIFKESKKPRFKQDGVSHEVWFSSLSTIADSFFENIMGFGFHYFWPPLFLEAFAERLGTSSAELLPLSNLLSCVSGIKPIDELSNAQIEALGGSKYLIRELLSPTERWSIEDLVSCRRDRFFRQGFFLPDNLALIEDLCSELHGDLSERILAALLKNQDLLDLPFIWRSSSMDSQDRSTLVLGQFLLVLKLGAVDNPDIIPKGPISRLKNWRQYSTSFAKYMVVGRLFLRPHLDSHSLNFVDDFRHLGYLSLCDLDVRVFALFWALEMYDLYVPGPSYLCEIERISALNVNKGKKDSSEFIAERGRIVESLKSSYEEHVAHVAWALENLPIFKKDEPRSYWPWSILREMIIPRAARSKSDARYVFCFLSYTLDEPFSILEELFKTDMLLGEIKELSDLEMDGFAHFLKEIWQDLCHWPSLEAGDLQRLALCKDIREKVTRTLGGTRRGDVQGNVRADDPAVPGTDAGPRYSLFRPHKARKMDKDMQIWSENLFKALITSLNSHDVERRDKALILASGVPDIVLFSPKGCALVDEWLPTLSDRFKQNPKSAMLAEIVISVYNEYQRNKSACAESNTEGASWNGQKGHNGGDHDGQVRHENVNEWHDSDNVDNTEFASRHQKRTTEEVSHGSKRACIGM